MLDRISSKELTEWMAYEKAFGTLNADPYISVTLAHLVDAVQGLTYLTGKANWEDSPVPKPKPYPKPTELFLPRPEEKEAVGGADELNAYFDQK